MRFFCVCVYKVCAFFIIYVLFICQASAEIFYGLCSLIFWFVITKGSGNDDLMVPECSEVIGERFNCEHFFLFHY